METGRLAAPAGRAGRRTAPGHQADHHGGTDAARRAALEDARLLQLLKAAVSMRSLRLRAIYLALGFTAIGPLAAAYAEFLPLPKGARFILLPAAVAVLVVSVRNREWGRRAMVGYLAGAVATMIYDLLRLSLTVAGMFPGDPIPGIGRLLLDNPDASWVWGYVWRFFGNGAGMGMAFAMLPWRGVRSGTIYGVSICCGLFALLALVPISQEHFFPLTVPTAIGALLGHMVYGSVLGWLTSWQLPPVRWLPGLRSEPGLNRAIPAPVSRPARPGAPQQAPARQHAQVYRRPAAVPAGPAYRPPAPAPVPAQVAPAQIVPGQIVPGQVMPGQVVPASVISGQMPRVPVTGSWPGAPVPQGQAVPDSVISGPIPQVPPPGTWPPATWPGGQPATPSGSFPAVPPAPPGPPRAAPSRMERLEARRRGGVQPSRAQRHPPETPQPW